MATATPLRNSKRRVRLSDRYPQSVSFYSVGGGEMNARGVKNRQGARQAVSGLIMLPCVIQELGIGSGESPGQGSGESANSTHEITLMNYWPTISTAFQAQDDATGEIYNVMGVSHDAASLQTTIKARRAGK